MIINFIIQALCEQDRVYICGLGLFGKQQQSAQICEDKILPPSIIVTFDPNAEGDDYEFALFMAKAGGIVISKASMEIEKWVEKFNIALDNNKSISFEGFGTFAKDKNGVIGFESEIIPALNLEFEGMETIDNLKLTISNEMSEVRCQMPDIRREEANEDENNEELRIRNEELNDKSEMSEVRGQMSEMGSEELNENEDENSEELNDNQGQEQEKSQSHNERVRSKKVGIIITIIVILSALAASALYYFHNDIKSIINNYKSIHKTTVSEVVIVDTLACEEIPSTDTTDIILEEESTSFEEENTINQYETRYVDYESGKHYVIVGSFPSEKDVDRHIRDKQLERFNPKIVKQTGVSNLRICIGIFDSEAEADNFGRNSKQNYWILN